MRSDRELMALFADAIVDERPDPTFLDELFQVLVEEIAAGGPAVARGPLALGRRTRTSRWPLLIAAGVVIALLALGVIGLRPPNIGPPPSPTAAPSPTASTRVNPSTTLAPFLSATYGYSISYPSNWTSVPGSSRLDPTAYPQNGSSTVDFFSAGAAGVGDPGLTVAGPVAPAGTTLASWTASIGQLQSDGFTCPPAAASEPVQIGGQPGELLTWSNCPVWLLWAGVVQGTQAFHIIFFDRYAANDTALQASDKALFLGMLATVAFTGLPPTPPPVPSSTLVPFTSTTYGYSISYPSDLKVRRATTLLDSTVYPADTNTSVDYFSAGAPASVDPGLIIAGPTVPAGTTLASWAASIEQQQAAALGCPRAQASEPVQIGGDPGQLLTWTACPAWLLWAGVVHNGRAYHLIWIDQNATNDRARQTAEKALFLRILASVAFTTAAGSPTAS